MSGAWVAVAGMVSSAMAAGGLVWVRWGLADWRRQVGIAYQVACWEAAREAERLIRERDPSVRPQPSCCAEPYLTWGSTPPLPIPARAGEEDEDSWRSRT